MRKSDKNKKIIISARVIGKFLVTRDYQYAVGGNLLTVNLILRIILDHLESDNK